MITLSNGNISALLAPLWREPPATGGFPSQRISNSGNISKSYRHSDRPELWSNGRGSRIKMPLVSWWCCKMNVLTDDVGYQHVCRSNPKYSHLNLIVLVTWEFNGIDNHYIGVTNRIGNLDAFMIFWKIWEPGITGIILVTYRRLRTPTGILDSNRCRDISWLILNALIFN